MKLRLSGSGVRFRLTEADVAALRAERIVAAALESSGSDGRSWRYAVVASPQADALEVALDSDGLRVLVPAAEAMAWASSETVGLYGESAGVEVAIEKDLGCDHDSKSRRGTADARRE